MSKRNRMKEGFHMELNLAMDKKINVVDFKNTLRFLDDISKVKNTYDEKMFDNIDLTIKLRDETRKPCLKMSAFGNGTNRSVVNLERAFNKKFNL